MSGRNPQQNLLDLLDRPNEPVFLPKGDRGVIFNIPDDYLDERFKGENVTNRFGTGEAEHVTVSSVPIPDLDLPRQLPKNEIFSIFLPHHRRMAGRLIEVFMGANSLNDLLSLGCFCREKMNPQLFNYALTVAILHRPDTRNFELPPLCEFFPDKFIDKSIFHQARRETTIRNTLDSIGNLPLEIPMDYTATDLDIEHRVAYFREDIGLNLHHWHWHLVYPFDGDRNIVAKDRRGELFYYMHQQMVARYNFERLSNKLPRVKRLSNFREPIEEGYFPKLDNLSASRNWAARAPNTLLRDIDRETEQITFDISTLERWRDRIYDAVHTGRIIDTQGQSIALTETEGIDILGNIIEASVLTRNGNLYGDMHNFGHIAIALAHDPDNRHLETFSVMGDPATTMRDPLFYRWHAFVDDIFQNYKGTLSPYTAAQLNFDGIQVTGVEINTTGVPQNTLNTFWQQNDINLARGMDFMPRNNVFARFTHLQHQPFEYRITVNNSGQTRQGTVRIFLAPNVDERGLPFLYRDQRNLFIELDKFEVTLNPNENVVTRRSTEASVSIPFEQSFRNLNAAPAGGTALGEFNYCGCGWPQHLLIPKGNPEGLSASLFVMVSNFQDDRVEDPNRVNSSCKSATSYCGLRDSRYPDRKAMGYPFDRNPRRGVDTLQQFLTANMRVKNVVIRFTNRIEPPFSTPSGQQTGQQQPSQQQAGQQAGQQRPGQQRPGQQPGQQRPGQQSGQQRPGQQQRPRQPSGGRN